MTHSRLKQPNDTDSLTARHQTSVNIEHWSWRRGYREAEYKRGNAKRYTHIRKNPNVYIELYRTICVIIDIIESIDISERCLLYSSIIVLYRHMCLI